MCKRLIFLVFVVFGMGLLGPGQGDAAGANPNVTVWYKLDETAGLIADDSSNYNRDGTLYQWPEDAGFTPGWDPDGGHFGGCLVFYDDTRITIPKTALSTVTNGITVSLWLKDAWRVGMNCVFDAGTSHEEDEVFRVMAFIGTAPDAEVLWRAGNDSNDTLRWDLDGGSVGDLEGWHLWTFVKDEVAGNIRIYFDGSLAESDDVVNNTLSTVLPTKLADGNFQFRVGSRNKQYNDLEGTVDEFVVYDKALSDDEVERLYYTGGDIPRGIAWKPSPANRAQNLCPDVVLSWTPGDYAVSHDVYLGTDRGAVENANTASTEHRIQQEPNSYDAGSLETLDPGITYYWRIDDVNDNVWAPPGSPWKGQVWEFTINDGSAFDPDPADGKAAVSIETVLSWSAGCWAASHNVYFGTDSEEVEDADTTSDSYQGNQELGETSFDPCEDLDYLTWYYWRIDEVNGATTWEGQVWSFQTENAITDPNFLLWYRLDESEGREARDSSNYLRHAVVRIRDFLLTGAVPDWDPDGGRWGGSLGFDDDTAIWVPTTTLNKLSDAITIVVWIQTGTNWAFQANGGDSQLTLQFETGVGVTWRAGNDTNDVLTMGGSPGGWNHYAFIKDETEGNIQIYFNGELAESDDVVDNTLIGVRSKPFKIGGRTKDPADFRDARMDDFMVYDRALTAAEVTRQYYSGGPVGELGEAWMPYPADGATEVPRDVVLSWKPGDYAASHDVYFGTDWDDVNDANTSSDEFIDNNEPNEWDPPGELDFLTTYYWRIDEVNESDGNSPWKGGVWSFTVANFLIIDDMETYDQTGNRIYNTWEDGYGNGTGSEVGLGVDPVDPVHRGKQSMDYEYYNNDYKGWDLDYYSEISVDVLHANLKIGSRDWTQEGVKTLTMFFYGQRDNDANEQMYAGLEDTTGAGSYAQVDYGYYGEDMNDIKEEEWQQWDIALADFTDVVLTDVKYLYIGFGIRGNPNPEGTPGGTGTVYFDDIRLYRPKCVPWRLKPVADFTDDCQVTMDDLCELAGEWLRRDIYFDDCDDPGTLDLVGHWKLDDNTGTTAIDSSTYAHNGTITGEYEWVEDHNDGYAVEFTMGICRVPDALHLRPAAQVSASAWINYSVDQGASPRIVVKGGDNHEAYCIELSGNDSLRFYVRDTSGTSYNADSPDDAVERGEWVHLAGTYDGALVKCYVNGQVVGDNDQAIAIPLSQDTNDLAIGNRPDANDKPFKGTIDEVRVYKRALTDAEVAWLASDGACVIELTIEENIYNQDDPQVINFRDFDVMLDAWLDPPLLWPQ